MGLPCTSVITAGPKPSRRVWPCGQPRGTWVCWGLKTHLPSLAGNFCMDISTNWVLFLPHTAYQPSWLRTCPAGPQPSKSCWRNLCSGEFTLPNLDNAWEGNKQVGKAEQVITACSTSWRHLKMLPLPNSAKLQQSCALRVSWVQLHILYSLKLCKHAHSEYAWLLLPFFYLIFSLFSSFFPQLII